MIFLITINILSIIFILYALFILINTLIKARTNNNPPIPKSRDKKPKIAFLLPARDESAVIDGLLRSIQQQTYSVNMKDVYVIVERMDDPTVAIATGYGCTIVLRRDLTLRRKGYALDDAIQHILEEKKSYDLYFIFDADNILSKTYLACMLETYYQGYDIGLGARRCKNGLTKTISICSSLTFSLLNTLGNIDRVKKTKNITISGSGVYLTGKLIDSWRGFPFHTLTEDYELSLYATVHNLTTSYNQDAYFYDEQPTSYHVSAIQRKRWVKGFMQSRKLYVPHLKKVVKEKNNNYGSHLNALTSVQPYAFLAAVLVIHLLVSLGAGIYFQLQHDAIYKIFYYHALACFGIGYLVILCITFIMLRKERSFSKYRFSSKAKGLFMNPLFLMTFVPVALKAIFSKDVEWKKIEHHSTEVEQ